MAADDVIVSFESHETRDEFVERLQSARLHCDLYIPRRRPDVVIEHLASGERSRLDELVGSEGTIHEDIEFKPMTPPGKSSGLER